MCHDRGIIFYILLCPDKRTAEYEKKTEQGYVLPLIVSSTGSDTISG
jgi:hypothetical protein